MHGPRARVTQMALFRELVSSNVVNEILSKLLKQCKGFDSSAAYLSLLQSVIWLQPSENKKTTHFTAGMKFGGFKGQHHSVLQCVSSQTQYSQRDGDLNILERPFLSPSSQTSISFKLAGFGPVIAIGVTIKGMTAPEVSYPIKLYELQETTG